MGPRPTKLTPTLMEAIVAAVRLGVSQKTAAEYVNISPQTLSEWIARGTGKDPLRPKKPIYAELAEALTQARAADELRRVGRLELAAKGGAVVYRRTQTLPNGTVLVDERFTPPDWRADAYVLSHSRPKEWGDAVRMSVQVDMEQAAAIVAEEIGKDPKDLLMEAQRVLRKMDHAKLLAEASSLGRIDYADPN